MEAFNNDNGSMRLPDYTRLKALPYVRWVLKESESKAIYSEI